MMNRFDRNIRLFGVEGQRKLNDAHVAVVGCGGVGSPAIQQVALLGVGELTLVDHQDLSRSNRNRYVTARECDPIPGSPKTALGARLVGEIDTSILVHQVKANLLTAQAQQAVSAADYVIGGFDEDGPRFVLNALCRSFEIPYIDLASDVLSGDVYGGRVFISDKRPGCLYCNGLLDMNDVTQFLLPWEQKENIDNVYGVDHRHLGEIGPSVAPLNGVVAALGAMEFMALCTGLRPVHQHLQYRGDQGVVRIRQTIRQDNCYYCYSVRGTQGALMPQYTAS